VIRKSYVALRNLKTSLPNPNPTPDPIPNENPMLSGQVEFESEKNWLGSASLNTTLLSNDQGKIQGKRKTGKQAVKRKNVGMPCVEK
jgi:hypothetical protein